MNNPTLRRVLVVTAVVGATLGGGIAVAAWTSSGAGTAGAKAGTASAPSTGTVDAAALTTGLLYPGTSGTALIRITNPNPYGVKVSGVTANGTPTATGSCPGSAVTWIAQQPNSVLAAGATATLTLTTAVSMASSADDSCQGAVFTIPVTVTVVSQ
ncbi:hypothetical protein [Amycolatopsis sp. cg9]|uniref:hypothetical protein n=1 Tax=Amycolatopsis sp. cg9 TaxID=3238801 RepID=UPI0035248D54